MAVWKMRHCSFQTRVAASMILCASMVTGCQSASSTAIDLPGPNFSGPAIEQPTSVAPPVLAKVEQPRIKPEIKTSNIPKTWFPNANASPRKWTWIVVHHSATDVGGAARFDRDHRLKWDELGYHFVIGNGTDTADGLVEVGSRWPVQKHGAHAKSPDNRYNEFGIGICLVGNFNDTQPTPKQMASLTKLIAFLADRYGITQNNIISHKMTGKQTDCPGKNMDINALRASVAKQRVALTNEPPAPVPGQELMLSDSR